MNKEKILDICRKIEQNDPEILSEMANLILFAREQIEMTDERFFRDLKIIKESEV
jgi:hypothetical protein